MKHNGPIKCKLALWLALNNKLLRWDNGMKRGWIRPSKCSLCIFEEETIYHLFITWPFSVQVCCLVKTTFTPTASWDKNSLVGLS